MWKRFRAHGWDFRVFSNRMQPESRLLVNFEYQEAPFSFGTYRRMIQESAAEVVMFHLLLKDKMFWFLAHWLKMRGTPFICWTKGANLDRPNSKVRYLMFNYLHSLSSSLILYSPHQIPFISPANRRKVFVANNTVNFEDFPAVTETKESIKAEFRLPFSKLVLFVGTMGIDGERKKVEHLIEIFGRLDRRDIGLVIVGGGMSDALKARINAQNTVYLGQVHDPDNLKISKLFKAADLFVIPGHVGLGINQAFYWGLPVITEEGSQPPEIQYLKNGRNGFMVPENDLDALKAKMLYLLDNDAVRQEFGRAAREDILKEAPIEGMFQSFFKAVETAAAFRDRNDRRQSGEVVCN